MQPARLLAKRPIHHGRVIDVSVDTVQLPNGNTIDLDLVRHPGAAAIVAIDADDTILMVRQYRYASGGWLHEVPAGKLDNQESPESCAARELEEETGVVAERLTPLGSIWTSPGFCDERIWLFLATGLRPTQQALEADEVLTILRMPFADAVKQAQRGEIDDAKSVCAILRAQHFLTKSA